MSIQAATDVVRSATASADRSASVSLAQKGSEWLALGGWALCHPLAAWERTRSIATSRVSQAVAPRLNQLGCFQANAARISHKVATLSYDATQAASVTSYLGRGLSYGVSSLVGSLFGAEAQKSADSLMQTLSPAAASLTRQAAIAALANRVFLPVVSILQETVLAQGTQFVLDKAVDTAALACVGSLDVSGRLLKGDLAQLTTLGTTLQRTANVGKVVLCAYVYKDVVISSATLTASCLRLRKLKKSIDAALRQVDLQSLLDRHGITLPAGIAQAQLATALAFCLENSPLLAQVNLVSLLNNAALLGKLLNAVCSRS